MRIVLGGAYGNLGRELLKVLVNRGHEVVAADLVEREVPELSRDSYTFKKLDVTDAAALRGICDGADIVITTVGLVSSSRTLTNYDIDYRGNLNLLNEVKAAGVKKFVYVSVLKADDPRAEGIAMLHAKAMLEEEIKRSGLEYLIVRPTGYFYDIAKVFRPMIEKGTVQVLDPDNRANVIDTPDLAEWMVDHMTDAENAIVSIGGTEVYTYREIAEMCFTAAGKPTVVKTAPAWLFDVLAFLARVRKTGKEAVIRFGKWTMTEDMVAEDVHYGAHSFRDYIKDYFQDMKQA